MKRSLAIMLLVMILIVTGCQQTPEKAPVIGKAGDYLDAVEETSFQPIRRRQACASRIS